MCILSLHTCKHSGDGAIVIIANISHINQLSSASGYTVYSSGTEVELNLLKLSKFTIANLMFINFYSVHPIKHAVNS